MKTKKIAKIFIEPTPSIWKLMWTLVAPCWAARGLTAPPSPVGRSPPPACYIWKALSWSDWKVAWKKTRRGRGTTLDEGEGEPVRGKGGVSVIDIFHQHRDICRDTVVNYSANKHTYNDINFWMFVATFQKKSFVAKCTIRSYLETWRATQSLKYQPTHKWVINFYRRVLIFHLRQWFPFTSSTYKLEEKKNRHHI